MKLADWARKQGIAYLTAYRWFRDGKLPVKAYQSDSGTIIVDDEEETSEQPMLTNLGTQNDDVMGLVLNKVVELSKNNATVTDLAVYILSNFSLKLKIGTESPRYSKNKPRSEDIQKHFQQFIPKGERPKPNMFVTSEQDLDNLVEADEHRTIDDAYADTKISPTVVVNHMNSNDSLYNELASAFNMNGNVINVGSTAPGSMVSSTIITPQNYTKSTDRTFGSLSDLRRSVRSLELKESSDDMLEISDCDNFESDSINGPTGAFKPTQKEIELSKQTFDAAPRRRGRKPTKNLGKK